MHHERGLRRRRRLPPREAERPRRLTRRPADEALVPRRRRGMAEALALRRAADGLQDDRRDDAGSGKPQEDRAALCHQLLQVAAVVAMRVTGEVAPGWWRAA